MEYRQTLLNSIAAIISDYRKDEIPELDSNHIEKWVTQFNKFGFGKDDQLVILEEMNHLLKTHYISYTKASEFIQRMLNSPKIFGENPEQTIENFHFLQIQTKGNSQNDLLNICDLTLKTMYDIELKDCGVNPTEYIYLDDCLYSGNRVLRDIVGWLPSAKKGTTLHIIFFGIHTASLKYVQKKIIRAAALREITVNFRCFNQFENSKWNRHTSKLDFFWPRDIPEDEYVDQYVDRVNAERAEFDYPLPPLFRPNNIPNPEQIFSTSTGRQIIESAFLKAGAYIISLPKDPHESMRPLGYEFLSSLGFGAILITYRNIANNCPLALWWGDSEKAYPLSEWYPLFPRTVNVTPAIVLEDF